MKTHITNPFGINHYLGPDLFCNREVETEILINNVLNQKHTAFFALRRLGKTTLIKHLFYLLSKKKKVTCLYIDIYATQELKDLNNCLAKTIYSYFPENKGIGKKFWEFIKLFRPIITIDELTGAPELSLDISKPLQIEKTLPQLLKFLDLQNTKTVIALDEFQQILQYPEKNVEALLRTIMQELKNVTFIFCGSNQEMMHQIFNSAKKPFYASCSSINLQKIDTIQYHHFIKKIFTQYQFTVAENAINYILDFTDSYTYYTQRICHQLFLNGNKEITIEIIQQTILDIFNEQEGNYYQIRNLLTGSQWQLLLAMAKEEKVFQPFGNKFIQKYKLGSSAMVKRSLDALIVKEMVYKSTSTNKPYFAVYDKFLMRWLMRK